jgi:hypothetical protein
VRKNFKDLGVGQNLTEFTKIFMPESLKKFLFFFFKKNEYFNNFEHFLKSEYLIAKVMKD